MQPFYLAAADGAQLFAMHWPPTADPVRRAVLVLPPLAEEMNKCRHMIAAQARAFAARGMDVLSVDLFGTGDSDGEFVEARWPRWLRDLQQARDWLAAERGAIAVQLFAVRGGALFVPALLSAPAGSLSGMTPAARTRVMLWQPVLKGGDAWRQLLRMRLMADNARGQQVSSAELEQRLEQHGWLEIGGYSMAAPLVAQLNAAEVQEESLQPAAGVLWAEVSGADPPALSTAATRICKKWTQGGIQLETAAVRGEPFWSTPELGWARDLLEPTCSFALAP